CAVAEGEVGQREEAVDEEEHAHHPADEGGPARVERGEVDARQPLRAEAVSLAVRGSVAIEEATARGLSDEAAEPEIVGFGGWGRAVVFWCLGGHWIRGDGFTE